MLIIFLYINFVYCQWILLEKNSPELLTTEKNAQCSGRSGSSLWCFGIDDLYMFGGFDGKTEKSDIWKYEIENQRWIWQPDPPTTVKPVQKHCYWGISNELWIYGGYSSTYGIVSDMWKYEPEIRKWTFIVPQNLGPGPIYGSAFWTHTSTNTLYLYGGSNSSKLWSYNIKSNQWKQIHYGGDSPGPRIDASAVIGHNQNIVYLFGGSIVENGPSIGRMRQLDLTTMTWSITPLKNRVGPSARSQHLMWMTPTQDRIVIFGGKTGVKILNDQWYYNREIQEWHQDEQGPSARYGSSKCIDKYGELYFFGGSLYNDIWKNGRLSSENLYQILDSKLYTTKNAALMASVMSTLVVIVFFFIGLFICVKKCKKSRFIHGQAYQAEIDSEI